MCAVIAKVPKKNPAVSRRRDYRSMMKSRTSILVAVALSVLLHAIGLWFFANRAPELKEASSGDEARITVALAPPPAVQAPRQDSTPATAARPPEKIPRRHPTPKKSTAKKSTAKKPVVRAPTRAPKIVSRSLQPETLPRKESLPDDMFTQLEEARKRRAEAGAMPSTAAPDSAQNDNSVALANIARSVKQARGNDRINAGGVFEVRHMGYQDAEVVFWGWSAASRRNAMRLITIKKPADVDMETAVVNKIIDVIREEKNGDFIWDSHRLDRQITLSARPQDTVELRRFLMREFFPEHLPVAAEK
jgi:hypothetical protein